jgi:AraC-like DNA-binding protein
MEPKFESVEADAASSFRSMWFTCASFAEDHTWHYHPEFELVWIVRSHGTRFIGDNIAPFRAGDVVLLGPNLPHCWHDEAEANQPGPEVLVLQFRPETFGGGLLDLPEFEPIKRLFRASKCGLQVGGATAVAVQQQMRALLEKRGMARLLCLIDILRVLAEAEHDLHSLASVDYHITNDITQINRQRIESIHRYVRESLGGDINQAEVARRMGLTPPAFSRFFRRATGQTFVGFVNILRINEVCRRMTESNDCITDIAMDCGYNNIANFNRQFLALKGMNPTQFREHHLRLKQKVSTFAPDQTSSRRVHEHSVSMAS